MLCGLLAFTLLVVTHVVAWFMGMCAVVCNIRDKHPHAFAEIVAQKKRGGKDAS